MIEKWKAIIGFEGFYEIFNHGRIKTLKNSPKLKAGSMLRLQTDTDGYIICRLYKNTRGKTVKLHRVVAFHFIKPSKKQVDHVDNVKANNRVDNLEYVTNLENRRRLVAKKLHVYGEKSISSKLTNVLIKQIKDRYAAGGIFHSQLAIEYGVSQSHIGRIIRGERWAHLNVSI